MIQLGLIGYPLSHSLSPKIHAAALQACGLTGNYSLFPIRPDDKQRLSDLLSRVRSGEIHGLNVTIPYKQNVIPLLDELTPTAQAIGAVNTIYLCNNQLIGDNTDAPGFLTDLNRFLAGHQSKIANRKLVPSEVEPSAIVIGAGGSARAVVYALLTDGWNVTIAARRVQQAEELASAFASRELRVTSYEHFILHLSSFILLVNTTPLGMFPDVNASPLPENVALPKDMLIYDLVYNPCETKLVKVARAQGLSAATGLDMLIEQAALTFKIWTQQSPPRETLRAAVD